MAAQQHKYVWSRIYCSNRRTAQSISVGLALGRGLWLWLTPGLPDPVTLFSTVPSIPYHTCCMPSLYSHRHTGVECRPACSRAVCRINSTTTASQSIDFNVLVEFKNRPALFSLLLTYLPILVRLAPFVYTIVKSFN